MVLATSATARLIALPSTAGNPSVSVRRSSATRTTESNLGLLYSDSINNRPPRCPDVRSWSLLTGGRGKIFMRNIGGLLGEVVGGSEISAKEPDLAVYIPLEERRSVGPRELTMNRDGRGPGNGCYLPGLLAACLESPNCATKNYEVGDTRGVAVAVAIHMRKSLFLELMNQVFVQCDRELRGQLDFVRLDHLNLDRRHLDLDGLVFPSEQRTGGEKQGKHRQPNTWTWKALHCFSSLLGEVLEGEGTAVGSPAAVVWAPCATSCFLMASADPPPKLKKNPREPPPGTR